MARTLYRAQRRERRRDTIAPTWGPWTTIGRSAFREDAERMVWAPQPRPEGIAAQTRVVRGRDVLTFNEAAQ